MEWLSFILDNPIFVALAKTLLHFSWQGVLVAGILFLFLKNTDNRHSNLRYSASLGGLVICFIAPVATFLAVYDPQISITSAEVKQVLTGVSASAIQLGAAIGTVEEGRHFSVSLATTELAEQMSQWRFEAILPFLAIAWMVGVVALSSQLIVQMTHVYKLPHQGTNAPETELQQTFERLMEQLGVKLAARLLVSNNVDVPMVIGWLKPVVLLPASMVVGLTQKQLEMLLAHELAHVRRHDYMVNFLQTLVEVMLFFHPGVKWISSQIRKEREYCCDDVAVSHCGSAIAYASALTEAELSRASHIPELAMAATGGDLKQRVFRVIGHTDCAAGTDEQWHKGHWAGGMLAAIFSITIVMFIFSAREVVGMTAHYDKSKKEDKALIVIEPPTVEEKTVAQKISEKSKRPEQQVLFDSDKHELDKQGLNETQVIDNGPKLDVVAPEMTTEGTVTETTVTEGAVVEGTVSEELVLEKIVAARTVMEDTVVVESFAEETGLESDISDEIVSKVEASKVVEAESVTVEFAQAISKTTELVDNADIEDVEASSDLVVVESPSVATEFVPVEQVLETIEPVVVKQAPVLLKNDQPSYPRQALRRNLYGDVLVSFDINKEGRVENITFGNDLHRSFESSVTRALNNWRFEPAMEDGKPVVARMSKVFSFTDPKQNSLMRTGTRIARL